MSGTVSIVVVLICPVTGWGWYPVSTNGLQKVFDDTVDLVCFLAGQNDVLTVLVSPAHVTTNLVKLHLYLYFLGQSGPRVGEVHLDIMSTCCLVYLSWKVHIAKMTARSMLTGIMLRSYIYDHRILRFFVTVVTYSMV